METKKRRYVRRTADSYIKEVSGITDGEYSVLGQYINSTSKITHRHNGCGHEWEVSPNVFVNIGSRCPKCYGRKIRTPESYRKEVSEITNGEYSVIGEFKGTDFKIEHIHNDCGHVYKVRPTNFLHCGNRCPKCSLDKTRKSSEKFLAEVFDIFGDEYTVEGEYVNTNSKIKIRHNKECGEVFYPVATQFLGGIWGCPKCAAKNRNLKSEDQFALEVHALAGDEYSFLEAYTDSRIKAKVRHNTCGHVYSVRPASFLRGSKCPKCADLSRELKLRERAYNIFESHKRNVGEGEYVFLDGYVNSNTKMRINHLKCGRVFEVTPSNFFRGTRCPNCIYSRGEKAVADVLDSLSIDYNREHIFEYLGRKRFDFFIPSINIAIEYDGKQHFESSEHWGGEDKLKRTQESDALKNDFCDFMGIDLLRIPYWEFDNIDEIVTNFIDTVKLMRSISANGSEMAKCR